MTLGTTLESSSEKRVHVIAEFRHACAHRGCIRRSECLAHEKPPSKPALHTRSCLHLMVQDWTTSCEVN